MPDNHRMIVIDNPDEGSHRRALGFLAGRFSLKTWATGEIMIPESALSALDTEGISYRVKGYPTYETMIPGPVGNRPPQLMG